MRYLADLGVSHLYSSPILQAVPGSPHGYDVVDPTRVSLDLGGEEGLDLLSAALRRAGLGLVVDIVPNHMATHPANRWWWDVLEDGRASPFATYFDVDWGTPHEPRRLMVPILDDRYGRLLDKGGLRLGVSDLVVVRIGEHELPLSPRTLGRIAVDAAAGTTLTQLEAIGRALATLVPTFDLEADQAEERRAIRRGLTDELSLLIATQSAAMKAVDEEIDAINSSVERLDGVLRAQNYRLAYWRVGNEELNYRRFFNIDTLVGVRIEAPEVFDATHRRILDLIASGTIDGLRIDHIDGLRDPTGYLHRLHDSAPASYVVVEKVLAPGESLPEDWPVAGTTGYEFLFRVNNLFVSASDEESCTSTYSQFTGDTRRWEEVLVAAKRDVMARDLRAEVARAVALLVEVASTRRGHLDRTHRELTEAVREFVAHFGVYRTYTDGSAKARRADRRAVAAAISTTCADVDDIDVELLELLGSVVLGRESGPGTIELRDALQSLTAPVMAKGTEDTAFYRYNRLVSLNEVGGDPGVFGRTVEAFHRDMAEAARHAPNSMLTLATHDTKRGPDVRARIHVLAEIPESWRSAVVRWAEMNDRQRTGPWPDRNSEYLLYQTLIGCWPIERDRVAPYMQKAAREAKVHTSWTDPDHEYETALEDFVSGILADGRFVGDLNNFIVENRIVERGRRNSLAQTALLLTCPGVPDVYQGTETWDSSLVDPDNRRPVDFTSRAAMLGRLSSSPSATLAVDADAGAPKQWLIHRTLTLRKSRPKPFTSGDYEPLTLNGPRAQDVVAFTRSRVAVVVPRAGDDNWHSTTVELCEGVWHDVVTGAPVDGGRRRLDELFASFPVAVLAR